MDVTLYSPGTFQDGNIPQAGSDSLPENIFNKRGWGKKENKEEKSVKVYIKKEEGKKQAIQAQTDASGQGPRFPWSGCQCIAGKTPSKGSSQAELHPFTAQ